MKTIESQFRVKLVTTGTVPSIGTVAIIDSERLEELSPFAWRIILRPGRSIVLRGDRELRLVRLADQVYGKVPEGFRVAHCDANDMNCQQSNLRLIPKGRKQRKPRSREGRSYCGYPMTIECTSRYIGVSRISRNRKWRATATLKGKTVHLGTYPGTERGEIDAACRYDAFCREHFGESAVVNFP